MSVSTSYDYISLLKVQERDVFLKDRICSKEIDLVIDTENNCHLHLASFHGYDGILQFLIQNGAATNKRNKSGSTSLHIACSNGHANCVQLLVNNSLIKERDYHGCIPLHNASAMGHYNCVELLLKYSTATINTRDNASCTALFYACKFGRCDIVTILLHYGARPLEGDMHKRTPLHVACEYGHLEIVKVLCETIAATTTSMTLPVMVDEYGWTPLHMAAANNQTSILKYLIATWAVPCEPLTMFRRTPLHWACRKQHTDCAIFLSSIGCDLNRKDSNRCSSIETVTDSSLRHSLIGSSNWYRRKHIAQVFHSLQKACSVNMHFVSVMEQVLSNVDMMRMITSFL